MQWIKQEILLEIEANVRKWYTHTAMQKRNHGHNIQELGNHNDTNLRTHEQGQAPRYKLEA